jgi:hypothetical protein
MEDLVRSRLLLRVRRLHGELDARAGVEEENSTDCYAVDQ